MDVLSTPAGAVPAPASGASEPPMRLFIKTSFARTALVLTAVTLGGTASGQTTNIAPLGVASQHTTYDTISEAWRAVDGFTDGNWTFNSANRLSSTNGQPGAWWQLVLPRPFEVTEVVLFNRTPFGERLSNFRISLLDNQGEVFGQNYFVGSGNVPNGGTAQLLAPAGTFASRIRVEFINGVNNLGNGFLTLAEVQVFSPTRGTTYCSPASSNVSGVPAAITVAGSTSLSSPVPTALVAHGMPEQTFGYFLVGSAANSVTPPGSNGALCLGGMIGRYSNLIHNTSRTENMGIVLDRTALPVNPARAIAPGETWRFQAWFRDGASSNFSDAVAVTFQQ